MPTKAELYAQMAEKVTTQLTGSWQEWAGFLTTASRLYKYPFHEQLMIYAQRPDATACEEYDLWTEKMGRYVDVYKRQTLPSPSGVYQSGNHTAQNAVKLPVSVRKLPDTSPL